VPLFVEELTKAVLESAAQGDRVAAVLGTASLAALSVPATLHASLMARLDRLGPMPWRIGEPGRQGAGRRRLGWGRASREEHRAAVAEWCGECREPRCMVEAINADRAARGAQPLDIEITIPGEQP
jgi:hypothetical protein